MNNAKYDNAFKATLHGILDLFKKQTPIGELSADERLDGKTCLVTGANSGLGFAISTQFAERGARVIMACRSGIPEAGEQVRQLSASSKVEMMAVDLSDLKSIDAFVERLCAMDIHFDVSVFNAAVVPSGSKRTSSGFDQMFLVNYLSTFKLANQLIARGLIVKNTDVAPRIIFVSSESHRSNQNIDFIDLGKYEEYTIGKVIALYGYYKLLLNTFATELHRRINSNDVSISIFALCPGPVNSNIARAAPALFQPLLKIIFSLFFKAPADAAKPVLYLACAKSLQNKSATYLHLMQAKDMDPKALDESNGKKLWQKSEELLQLAK